MFLILPCIFTITITETAAAMAPKFEEASSCNADLMPIMGANCRPNKTMSDSVRSGLSAKHNASGQALDSFSSKVATSPWVHTLDALEPFLSISSVLDLE